MIKVLVIDDSAIVRRVLSDELSKSTDIEVVGTAIDPYVAREKIVALQPDVITLDLEMPRMGGLEFLDRLMVHHPLPVIVVSSHTPEGSEAAMRALELGALDVICKPGAGYSVAEIARMLTDRIRAAASARRLERCVTEHAVDTPMAETASFICKPRSVLAIGASTGGIGALKKILLGFPANGPATLIVQHMPARFTTALAERLDRLCLMEVREANDHDQLCPGLALVAPGNRHMTVRRKGNDCFVEVKDGPPVNHQRPSVDVLFHSMVNHVGTDAVGALLTGMGTDGAKGLLAMREAGAFTIAQDKDTCIIFGMSREAIKLGAATTVAPVERITQLVLRAIYPSQTEPAVRA